MKVRSIAFFRTFGHILESHAANWGEFGARSAGRPGGNMSEGVSPSPRGTRPGFSVNTHNLIGGLTLAVLALLLLGYPFYVPNTVIPPLMPAALVLAGVAPPFAFFPLLVPRAS